MGVALGLAMWAATVAPLLWLAAAACASRIVGGELASIGEFPFLASLQRRRVGHCCVANLVTLRWLLTAAHCVSGPLYCRPEDYFVIAGVSNVTGLRAVGGQRGFPDLFVVHPLVRLGGSYDYDLALVRLEEELAETPRLRPVPLPWDTVDAALLYGEPCLVAGWGSTQKVDVRRLACCSVAERTGVPCHVPVEQLPLMKVELMLLPVANCSRELRRKLRENVHLCTLGKDKDACQGDSGAALVCQGVQVAVVSWGKGCASSLPGVYARVDTQMAWVHQVIADEPSRLPSPVLVAACSVVAVSLTLS